MCLNMCVFNCSTVVQRELHTDEQLKFLCADDGSPRYFHACVAVLHPNIWSRLYHRNTEVCEGIRKGPRWPEKEARPVDILVPSDSHNLQQARVREPSKFSDMATRMSGCIHVRLKGCEVAYTASRSERFHRVLWRLACLNNVVMVS